MRHTRYLGFVWDVLHTGEAGEWVPMFTVLTSTTPRNGTASPLHGQVHGDGLNYSRIILQYYVVKLKALRRTRLRLIYGIYLPRYLTA
jgi:hypothetical protein